MWKLYIHCGKNKEVFVVCLLLGNSPASEFRSRGITQKKTYNIQNTANVLKSRGKYLFVEAS